jgi:hypothetical protein
VLRALLDEKVQTGELAQDTSALAARFADSLRCPGNAGAAPSTLDQLRKLSAAPGAAKP